MYRALQMNFSAQSARNHFLAFQLTFVKEVMGCALNVNCLSVGNRVHFVTLTFHLSHLSLQIWVFVLSSTSICDYKL